MRGHSGAQGPRRKDALKAGRGLDDVAVSSPGQPGEHPWPYGAPGVVAQRPPTARQPHPLRLLRVPQRVADDVEQVGVEEKPSTSPPNRKQRAVAGE